MKERKKVTDKYIAIIHFLTAWLVIPSLGVFAVAILFMSMEDNMGIKFSEPMLVGFIWIVALIFTYIGVISTAKFIKDTYVVTNAQTIVRLSTRYAIILLVIFTIIDILVSLFSEELRSTVYELIIDGILSVASIVVFYFASKKFVKANV